MEGDTTLPPVGLATSSGRRTRRRVTYVNVRKINNGYILDSQDGGEAEQVYLETLDTMPTVLREMFGEEEE